MTPAERFILETIEGCVSQTHPSGNYWYKDDSWLFLQDFKNCCLHVSWVSIWGFLDEEFDLNRDEIKELLTNILYDYTDNGNLQVC